MAINTRLSNLNAAEDWKLVYESFKKISLTAYDYDTIRSTMVDYLRITYPDTFNDWIENNEFLFILDTLALLGQNLAFRMDLNSREAFLDTAERKDSVIRLASYISYSPRRNYSARGLVKLTQIKTNEDIRDSSGKQLKGIPIRWNDPVNPDWYEQFILVMNACLSSSNQFGDPVKQIVVDGVKNNIYSLNSIQYTKQTMDFNANVGGETMVFEVVNPDIDTAGIFFEREPSPQANKHIIYRNDGNGFSSAGTGFFLLFKQGSLVKKDFEFTSAVENRIIDITSDNINETDVWVQQINANGTNIGSWTKVPSFQSIPYNNLDRGIKKIYSITTKDNDQISIKFPDSKSGAVPIGMYRVWYRVSNGKSYTIKTSDIQEKTVSIEYRGKKQTAQESSEVTFTFSLLSQVQNSQEAETIAQIKARAPQMYYTQNRLITGEDYNIGPLALGNAVLKSKAINRTYSGHSRFIDFTDPTGKYQNTDIFCDSGAIYRDDAVEIKASEQLPSAKSVDTIIIDIMQPLLSNVAVMQRYQEYANNIISVTESQYWTPISSTTYNENTYGSVLTNSQLTRSYEVGALIRFKHPTTGATKWSSVIYSGDDGIVLSVPVTGGWVVKDYIPALRTNFSQSEIQNIALAMEKCSDFSIYYSPIDRVWKTTAGIVGANNITIGSHTYQNFISVEYNGSSWDFVVYGAQYVFCGGPTVKFFFVPLNEITDISTGTTKSDAIDILSLNVSHNGIQYTDDMNMAVYGNLLQTNGYIDGSRVFVCAGAVDQNGVPLVPSAYRDIVPTYTSTSDVKKYGTRIFFKVLEDYTIEYVSLPDSDFTVLDSTFNYTTDSIAEVIDPYKRLCLARNVSITSNKIGALMGHSSGYVVAFEYNGAFYFIKQIVGNVDTNLANLVPNLTETSDTGVISLEAAFYRAIQNSSNSSLPQEKQLAYYGYEDVTNSYFTKYDARVGIKYHWKHYAPDDNRIDPNKTNIIDMYVLTSSYKDSVTRWAKNANDTTQLPVPPSTVDLQTMFTEVEEKGSVSNTLIWHSATFVPLFGKGATDDRKADFKVIKAPTSKLSDDEVKQKIINLIDDYFDPDNWDFGETFYFMELGTYIQQQLPNDVVSMVIVPNNAKSKFGTLFEIPSGSEELFVSTATVANIKIINTLTKTNINIG